MLGCRIDEVQAVTGWHAARADAAVGEYRRFVELARLHPSAALVPAADVDVVWHLELAGNAPDAPRHVESDPSCVDDPRGFELTRALYSARWGEPSAVWSVAAACHIDAPKPDPVGPEPPPEQPEPIRSA